MLVDPPWEMIEDVDCLEEEREGEAHLDMVVQNIPFPTHVQVFTSGQGIRIINFAPKYSTCQSRQQERSPWRYGNSRSNPAVKSLSKALERTIQRTSG
jgi:hypothetical protein